jgi:hypothetical protein
MPFGPSRALIAALFSLPLVAQPRVLRFQRLAEPREGAFTILAPEGWRPGGGIVRVNPMTSGGTLNSIAAKLDFTLSSPDGRTVLHWYPETTYVDGRRMPAAALFPQGSNYNGALVWPLLNSFSYLEQAILRKAHANASGLVVKNRIALPQTADSYLKIVRLAGVPIDFRYDVGLMVVSYKEGGSAWDEVLYTAVQDFGPSGAGLWSNKDTFSARAPAGEIERLSGTIGVILNSVELNPRWVEGEIRGQMQRNEIAIRSQQDIARLDKEIVEHRQRTNAEINNQAFHNLMRTEEYFNPHTKKVEVGSNEFNNRWVNSRGEAIYTDDSNYDPKAHGLDGFVRSPIRKRFPDR